MKNTKSKITFSQIVKETGHKDFMSLVVPALLWLIVFLSLGLGLACADLTPLDEFAAEHEVLYTVFTCAFCAFLLFLCSLVSIIFDFVFAWFDLRKKSPSKS